MSLTSVWFAEYGWCYWMLAAIDCCAREIAVWSVKLRYPGAESIARDALQIKRPEVSNPAGEQVVIP